MERFFFQGLAIVGLDGKEGFIDKIGKIMIPLKYDFVNKFEQNLSLVQLGGKTGLIDRYDKIVIPIKYETAISSIEGIRDYTYMSGINLQKVEDLFVVKLDGKCGAINKKGMKIISFKYDSFDDFSEGLAAVELNGKYGFIDKTGKEVIPLKYDYAWSFSEGLARVELNDKCGFIDKTGKIVIPLKYDDAKSFSEGLAAVELNGKYGFIDKTGKEVIPCKYEHARDFSEGLASVKLNEKYGFIDKTGKEVIPCKYDDDKWSEIFRNKYGKIFDYDTTFIVLKLQGKKGVVDNTGKIIVDFKYNYVADFFEGLAEVKLNEKYGFIDKTGKEIIPCKYDDACFFSEGLAALKINGKWGIVRNPLLKKQEETQIKYIVKIEDIILSEKSAYYFEVNKSAVHIKGNIKTKNAVYNVKLNTQNTLFDNEALEFEKKWELKEGKNDLHIQVYDLNKKVLAEQKFVIDFKPTKTDLDNAQYYALLIGVKDYDDDSFDVLDYTLEDVKNLKNALLRYNFEVDILENPTSQKMGEEIENFINKINQKSIPANANVMIFFAGHGEYKKGKKEDSGVGYWIPKDAKKGKTSSYFSNTMLNDSFKSLNAKHILVASDACYSGGICGKMKGEKKLEKEAFEKLYQDGSIKALTSGNMETVPNESEFVKQFIQYLNNNKDKYISADDLFTYVKEKVMNKSPKQNPQNCPLDGNKGGTFIFKKK